MRGPIDCFLVVNDDRAGSAAHQAQDGFDGGGAPGSIASEQGHHLALVHRQVHAMQDVRLAIPGVQVADAQKFFGLSHGPPPTGFRPCPCRPRALEDFEKLLQILSIG